MKPIQAKEEGQPFLTDIQEFRRRARDRKEQSAVGSGYEADREAVFQILKTRSQPEYAEAASLLAMIKEILVAERIAIEIYSEIIRNLGNDNPTTRIMIENIVAKEEEHAENLKTLLIAIGKV
jgi:bacterioferritin